MENESHKYIQILEAIYYHKKERKVGKEGEIFFYIIENMHFWGTLKIKKFLNISIKVYEDEIFNRIVWYRWKARSS